MSDDPFEVRRRGQRRVRVITAWVAGLAAAGTGAVAVAVAATGAPSASGATTVQNPGDSSGGSGSTSSDDGRVPGDDGGFQAPAQLPGNSGGSGGFGGFGGGHASSGGS